MERKAADFIDYVRCMNYFAQPSDDDDDPMNVQFDQFENNIQCFLQQPQRSSEEILELIRYFLMHRRDSGVLFKGFYMKSKQFFTSEVSTWIHFEDGRLINQYFEDKF